MGESPLGAGVVTRSEASGKACPAKAGLGFREGCSEVSQASCVVMVVGILRKSMDFE